MGSGGMRRLNVLSVRHRDQMNVVAHQAVAEHAQFIALRVALQQVEIDVPAIVCVEHVLAVVAALGDMVRNAGD
jgi:hypothetical protein